MGRAGRPRRGADPDGATPGGPPRRSVAGRLRPAAVAVDDHGRPGRGGPPALGRDGPGQPGGGHGTAVRDDRSRDGPGDRQQPLHVDRAGAPAARDRLDVGRHGLPADRRQPRGQAPPADARLRGARCQPGRVQDALAQRAIADRPGRDRRDVRRCLPPAHDHARRVAARLRLLQHHLAGVAGGEGSARRRASRRDERPRRPAHPRRTGVRRVPAAGALAVRLRPRTTAGVGPERGRHPRRADRLDRRHRGGAPRLARSGDRGGRRPRWPHHGRLRRRPRPPHRRRRRARPGRPLPAPDGRRDRGRHRRRGRRRSGVPWVLGKGWMYAPFPGHLPTRAILDAVVADRPAYMGCYDGHTGWVNSAGLRAAGIDRDTPDPPDGVIVRDPATGEPTGVLLEGAVDLVTRVLPKPSPEATLAAMRRSIAAMHRAGITAIQDAWVEPDEVALWRALYGDDPVRMRARIALPMRPIGDLAAWSSTLRRVRRARRRPPRRDRGSTPGSSRRSPTASSRRGPPRCSSRTSARRRPGGREWEPDVLDAFAAEADRRGWQLEIHAIGDAGIRMALDAYERAAAANPGARPAPPRGARRDRHPGRHPALRPARRGRLDAAVSRRPVAEPDRRLGARTSAPNEPARRGRGRRSGARAASSRSARTGRSSRSTRCWRSTPPSTARPSTAIRSVAGCRPRSCRCPMRWPPTGTGRPTRPSPMRRRGTVRVGADADVVVLDRDLLAGGPSSIIGTTVALTVVGGHVVHRSEDGA